MIDGSSALQPSEYPTRQEMIQIVTEAIHAEIAPINQELANLRLAIHNTAKKSEAISPGEVDNKVEDAKRELIVQFENISNGFQSTVKEVQRVWQAHATESAEYRKASDKKFETINNNLLELRQDQLKMQENWISSSDNLRREVQTYAAQTQTNETAISNNRSFISDIDARGQQLEKGYNKLESEVKLIRADFKASQSDVKAEMVSRFDKVDETQEEISTFMTEQKTRSQIFNGLMGIVTFLVTVFTGHELDIVHKLLGG